MRRSRLERSLAPMSRSLDPTVLPERAQRTAGRLLREAAIVLVLALVASFVIKTSVVRTFWVPSASMSPTLLVDDRIVVNQLWSTGAAIERGAIIVFRDPGGWLGSPAEPSVAVGADRASSTSWLDVAAALTPADDEQFLVKRVIGIPGDRIECCGDSGRLRVNGVELREEYLALEQPGIEPAASETPFSVTVPRGSLWVMGDNRANSADSRAHLDGPTGGFVPIDDVVGTAIAIAAPASRWRWLGT